MKTLTIVLFLLTLGWVLPKHSQAQVNLVPNPSFEDTISCPTDASGQFGDQIYNLTHWFPAGNSPDYFNVCGTGQATVPINGFGVQQSYDGNGYVGLLTFARSNPSYREYVGVSLVQPLTIGTEYYFKMQFAIAYGGIQNVFHFSNNLGVNLSNTYYESNLNPIISNNNPLINIDTIITDTLNWLTLEFRFEADSSYQYLYIGNFHDSINTDTLSYLNSSWSIGAYYYIDDVLLTTDSTLLSLTSQSKLNTLCVYPNPAHDALFVNSDSEYAYTIFSMTGTPVKEGKLKRGSCNINVSDLPADVYIFQLDDFRYKPCKFLKL